MVNVDNEMRSAAAAAAAAAADCACTIVSLHSIDYY